VTKLSKTVPDTFPPSAKDMKTQVPTYDEAHRFADTLFPRELWDLAQLDLEAVRSVFAKHANALGAKLRFNLSAKHPHPACVLTKRVFGAQIEIFLWVEPSDSQSSQGPVSMQYKLAVLRTPITLGIHRKRAATWKFIAEFSRGEVQTSDPDFMRVVEDVIRAEAGSGKE
jgi:hypothetical protein